MLGILSVSGCSLFNKKQDQDIVILSIGDCEHGIVTKTNLEYVQGVWPLAQEADVLISGGCYQDYFIKK
jgi:hypothetical protein